MESWFLLFPIPDSVPVQLSLSLWLVLCTTSYLMSFSLFPVFFSKIFLNGFTSLADLWAQILPLLRCIYTCKFCVRFCIKLAHFANKYTFFITKCASLARNRLRNRANVSAPLGFVYTSDFRGQF